MNKKVNLRNKKTGFVKPFRFDLALSILRNNSRDFECADEKHQFIDNELIIRPSTKGSGKPTKPKKGKGGGKVPKPTKDTDGGV